MPTIRIDDENYQWLWKQAVGFTDSPNDIITRLRTERNGTGSLATLRDIKRQKSTRGRRGRATPKESYRIPILQALAESGGCGDAAAVLTQVERAMRETLNAFDYGTVSSGEPRWRNWARFERADMARDRLLKPDSSYGVWEMTDKGRRHLEEVRLTPSKQSPTKRN